MKDSNRNDQIGNELWEWRRLNTSKWCKWWNTGKWAQDYKYWIERNGGNRNKIRSWGCRFGGDKDSTIGLIIGVGSFHWRGKTNKFLEKSLKFMWSLNTMYERKEIVWRTYFTWFYFLIQCWYLYTIQEIIYGKGYK